MTPARRIKHPAPTQRAGNDSAPSALSAIKQRLRCSGASAQMMDDMARAAGSDAVAFRLAHAPDARSKNTIKRVARLARWAPRIGPRSAATSGELAGRGFAYARYSNGSTYVAMVADVTVERATGKVGLWRFYVSHDCGSMVNPDGVLKQVQGSVISTASRALLEERLFEGQQVTSTDWFTYPIMRFSIEQDDHDVLDAMAKAGAKIVLATDTRAWRERLAPLKAHHFAQHPIASLGYRELAEGG